jgi:flagellar basal body rod protein FlgG
MDNTTSILTSGLRARAEMLDLLANNLANSNSVAFKAEMERYSLYSSEAAVAANGGAEFSAQMPDLQKSWISFSQGQLEQTSRQLDFALEGPGFFVTESPSGNFLTRNGSFQLGADGQIRTREGFKVKLTLPDGTALPPNFRLDPQLEVDINRQGIVRQGNQPLARLDLYDVEDAQQLQRAGASYFALSDPRQLRPAAGIQVHQGWLEKSNADPVSNSVQLVKITRQFEMLQKALQLQGEMGKRSTEEVGRT